MEKNVPETSNNKESHRILLEHNLFIVWKPEYNLGIPIIDEQHRGIATTINSLYFGMQHNYSKEIFAPVISMMYDYTKIHFQIEEAFLELIDYTHVEKHRELHHELMLKLTRTGRQSRLEQDPQQFMAFLKSWWIDHICNEDLLFRDHLLAQEKR